MKPSKVQKLCFFPYTIFHPRAFIEKRSITRMAKQPGFQLRYSSAFTLSLALSLALSRTHLSFSWASFVVLEMHLKKTFYDDGSVSRLIWHHRLRLRRRRRRRRRRRQNGRLKRLTDEKMATSTDTMTTSETWILSLSAGSH